MESKLDGMGLKSTHTEPYVWYQPYFNTNGKEYYIFLTYVDSWLVKSDNPKVIMNSINTALEFHNGMVEETTSYLRVKLKIRKAMDKSFGWYRVLNIWIMQNKRQNIWDLSCNILE